MEVEQTNDLGPCILIADRGFVWVGPCVTALAAPNIECVYMTGGYSLAEWGPTLSLGEVAAYGPDESILTKKVPQGAVVPIKSVIALLPLAEGVWEKMQAHVNTRTPPPRQTWG